jgi:hypothetical protein
LACPIVVRLASQLVFRLVFPLIKDLVSRLIFALVDPLIFGFYQKVNPLDFHVLFCLSLLIFPLTYQLDFVELSSVFGYHRILCSASQSLRHPFQIHLRIHQNLGSHLPPRSSSEPFTHSFNQFFCPRGLLCLR